MKKLIPEPEIISKMMAPNRDTGLFTEVVGVVARCPDTGEEVLCQHSINGEFTLREYHRHWARLCAEDDTDTYLRSYRIEVFVESKSPDMLPTPRGLMTAIFDALPKEFFNPADDYAISHLMEIP